MNRCVNEADASQSWKRGCKTSCVILVKASVVHTGPYAMVAHSDFAEHFELPQVQSTLSNTFTGGTDIVVNNFTSILLNTESEAQLEVFNGSTHIGYVFAPLQRHGRRFAV